VTLTVRSQGNGPRATVVLLAWNAWEHTRACLDSLQLTLSLGDQVVVVDNGSTDGTEKGLVAYPWVEVVRNPENRGFAPGCNQGAAEARGDVIVFLNNDTVVHGGWLGELLAAFDDPEVGAAGPRSNNVSGDQLVADVPYGSDDPAAIGAFAEEWRRRYTGQTTESARLVGFCVAVRAEAFTAVHGFDENYLIGGYEDDDLCMALRAVGHRLVVAHGSYVHHAAHATFEVNRVDWNQHQLDNRRRFRDKWGSEGVPPLCRLSVCLIVKDEEDMLASCLESVADLADEIIVYDTGSTDRTIAVARAAGASVVEGYWDDSFARARNAALAHTHGEWVLSLDADETLLADPASLRALLADRRSDVEAYLVAIENLHGAGNARSVHTAVRLFRRKSCTWKHRLHEQVVAAGDSGRRLTIGYLSGTRIIHRGYAAEVFEAKHKAERNLAIARAALDDDGLSRAYALMNYGRALESAGRSVEAIESLTEAAHQAEDPVTHRLAVKNLIYILGRLGRFPEALTQVDELRRISVHQIAADIAEGRLRITMGDAQAGLSLLARVPMRGRDDDGMEYAAHMLAALRGEALASLGRFGPAADVVLDAVRTDGVLEADLGELASWLSRANRSPAEIGGALDPEDLMPVLGRVLRQPAAVADAILEGIWTRFPDRLEPLAAAGRVGPRLSISRALVWSSRLRRVGLAAACPLVAMANEKALDPRVRILASAAAYGSFGECAVVNAVHEARRGLNPQALVESTDEINRLAPGLLKAAHFDAAQVTPKTPTVIAPGVSERGRQIRKVAQPGPIAAVTRRGGLNIVGPFTGTSAEGAVARQLATALSSQGVAVSTASYQADGRTGPMPWTHRDDGHHPFETTLLVLSPEDVASYVIDNGAAAFEGRYMIGVWLWDLERPSELMGTAARMVHEIWVPSLFTAHAVALASERRVQRMLLPVQPRVPRRMGSQGPLDFTFVASVDYQSGLERQNALGVVGAFRAAFPPGAGPRLVIEAAHAARFPSDHEVLAEAVANRSDISLRHDAGGAVGQLLAGRAAGDSCYVSLHRSEGTGLNLAWAMACGIPTVVTGHSFSSELQGERDSVQVPCSLVPIPDDEYRCERGGVWAETDLDEAARAMRLMVDQPRVAVAKARRAQERARRQFSPARSVRAMRDRVEVIEGRRHRDDTSDRAVSNGQLASTAKA
jgi:GT2 family glycosyltransferase/tetratricopeptide (TPR) repeat protein